MPWKSFVKDYFTFSRKERIGIFVIAVIIVAVWITPQLIPGKSTQLSPADSSWVAGVLKPVTLPDSPRKLMPAEGFGNNDRPQPTPISYFFFDPNQLPPEGWKKLGIREKTAVTIQKYLAHGGHFYKPEDLKKIYGITPAQFALLEGYIRIPSAPSREEYSAAKVYMKSIPKTRSLVDVNTADSTAFIALPGIGNKLAARIINFRERLGGFYSISQVGETYGLADTSFQKIKSMLSLSTDSVKKININTASKEVMKSHPYIRWNLANAIVEYRTQHGNFSSLDDLKKISVITDELLIKMKPYLTF